MYECRVPSHELRTSVKAGGQGSGGHGGAWQQEGRKCLQDQGKSHPVPEE